MHTKATIFRVINTKENLKATNLRLQIFDQNHLYLSGASRKNLCHLNNYDPHKEQQVQQRGSCKLALTKSYGSDKMGDQHSKLFGNTTTVFDRGKGRPSMEVQGEQDLEETSECSQESTSLVPSSSSA